MCEDWLTRTEDLLIRVSEHVDRANKEHTEWTKKYKAGIDERRRVRKETNEIWRYQVEKLGGFKWYHFLGLEESASREQISSAFRFWMKVHHPDTTHDDLRGSADEFCKLITQAYEHAKREMAI